MPLAGGSDWSGFGPQLDPNLVNQQFETMRYNVIWRKGMVCPRRMLDKDNHDLNCTVCDKTGYLYDTGVERKMLITSVSLRQMYQLSGRFDAGMAMISAAPTDRMSWWDKITLTETLVRYSESFEHKNAGTIDKLKYPIQDGAVERGVIRLVDQEGVEYALDTDYTIADGKIQWAVAPTTGKFFSVAYLIRPTYIILDVTHHARTLPTGRGMGAEKTVQFPVQGVGKLDFLVTDENLKEE